MRHPERVAVLGLGLIGGSLARALAGRGVAVLGFDHHPPSLREAADSGAVTPLPPSLAGLERAQLVALAVPVGAATDLLRRAAAHLAPDALVTDLASVQRPALRAAEALGLGARFVGSHPLAGDHRSGWRAGRAELFAGARVFLVPHPAATASARERLDALWRSLGAHPEETTADAHDQRLAWSSHLPQLAESALAAALAARGVPRADLGPGGRDATRLAASSPALWREIALANADQLEPALAALAERLAELRAALRGGDGAGLERCLAAGRAWSEGG